MILGFTGVASGMTSAQAVAVSVFFSEFHVTVLHHGCCVGSDERAHQMARDRSITIIGHPPIVDTMMMPIIVSEFAELRLPKLFLDRDEDIAREGVGGLLATPAQDHEILRSGTWATVRRARKLRRIVWVVSLDGVLRKDCER